MYKKQKVALKKRWKNSARLKAKRRAAMHAAHTARAAAPAPAAHHPPKKHKEPKAKH